MVKLQDLPLVVPLAEWVWGNGGDDASTSSTSGNLSANTCLGMIPFLSSACLSTLIAKLLGVAIIVGSCLNKAPIMVNMTSSQSAAGFSRMGMYSETLVYANGAAYGALEGHPLTAYGENLALLVQNCILIGLIWKYTKAPQDDAEVGLSEKLALGLAATFYFVVVRQCLPDDMRYLLQASNGIILLYSRGAQVYETFGVKHTGANSIVTLSLNLIGGLARIFTTLSETGDMAVVMGFLLSVVLNFVLFVQYFIYKANTEKFMTNLLSQSDDAKKKKA